MLSCSVCSVLAVPVWLPVLAVPFWLSFITVLLGCHFLSVFSFLSALAVLTLQSCTGSHVLAVLSWPYSLALPVLFCLSNSAFPKLIVPFWLSCIHYDGLFWLSCPDCPLLSVLCWLSYPSSPVLAALCLQLCAGSFVLAVLCWQPSQGSPVLEVLSWKSYSASPVLLFLSGLSSPFCHALLSFPDIYSFLYIYIYTYIYIYIHIYIYIWQYIYIFEAHESNMILGARNVSRKKQRESSRAGAYRLGARAYTVSCWGGVLCACHIQRQDFLSRLQVRCMICKCVHRHIAYVM